MSKGLKLNMGLATLLQFLSIAAIWGSLITPEGKAHQFLLFAGIGLFGAGCYVAAKSDPVFDDLMSVINLVLICVFLSQNYFSDGVQLLQNKVEKQADVIDYKDEIIESTILVSTILRYRFGDEAIDEAFEQYNLSREKMAAAIGKDLDGDGKDEEEKNSKGDGFSSDAYQEDHNPFKK